MTYSPQVPEQWLSLLIGEIAEVVAGGTPKASNPDNFSEPGTQIPWLTPADLSKYSDKYISHGARDLSKAGYESSSAKLMPAETLLFSSRAPIGYVAVAANEISTNQGFKNFVLPAEIDSSYAYYFLRSIRDVAESMGTGTTFKEISGTNAKKLPFILPPLAEQKVIADKLDTLLAQVESTTARLERIPQILKRFRQSVLAAAVSGRLTEEWRHHSRLPNPTDGKFSDCIENMVGGASPRTSDYSDTGMLALNKGDIKEYGRIEGKRNPKYVPLDFVENNSKKVIPDGTLVVTLRDLSQKADFLGLIGRYRGQEHALITQGMYGLKVKPHVALEDYLIAFSNSPQYRAQVKKEKVGATQVHLRNGQFLDITVPFFVIEEQTEIVRRVDQLFAHADRIEQQINNALARVNNLTQSILAKAFRGELTEQWRKDNPELISGENSAEALLERIKAERAVATKPKRRTSKT
ncbi:restriction endonuclease subunit S [Marinobacter alkaliphilus]|uniref:Restriction endonuclease subunit S n=1 Tax=Marinobacter alkaliphilus TaxID=254719 RepID=A0ABZ3E2U7_9GAMM